MGGIFSKPKSPAPPKVVAPPPPPDPAVNMRSQEADQRRKQRARTKTILTSDDKLGSGGASGKTVLGG